MKIFDEWVRDDLINMSAVNDDLKQLDKFTFVLRVSENNIEFGDGYHYDESKAEYERILNYLVNNIDKK